MAPRRADSGVEAAPESVTRWEAVPAIPVVAFKELELTSLPPDDRRTVFHSSGTTGQSVSRHFHDSESLALYAQSLLAWFKFHCLPGGAIASASSPPRSEERCLGLLCLTPSPALAPHSSLAYMFDVVTREYGAGDSTFAGQVGDDGTWHLDLDAALVCLRRSVERGQALMLLGTAFLFVHLLDALRDRKLAFALPTGSRVLETGGYKGRSRTMSKAGLHSLIEERLGIPAARIVCEYGMSELSSQAYDLVLDAPAVATGDEPAKLPERVFRFPPWTRVQIISPETGRPVAEGEVGLIRVFDLANARSVMAVQTEDLGIHRGDGFKLIGRAVAAEPRGCSLMSS